MNRSYCVKCSNLVPSVTLEREGKIYLTKNCPTCGTTETLIASDSGRYLEKQRLDNGFNYRSCSLQCLSCDHKRPNIVFIDITNRCNLVCPICINNTPSMGFVFEPPMEYFEKIFDHLSTFDPIPSVQLFGGEPTVRRDLLQMIKKARAKGIQVRVVTNGLKLADEEYCRKLVRKRATILLAYDGDKPETYALLRGREEILQTKLKALDNLGKIPNSRVVLMSLVAKGINDEGMDRMFQFCHDRRHFIRGIYFMPLAHTWNKEDFDLEPERITGEDVEDLVEKTFPGESVHFIPAGFLGQIPTLRKALKVRPIPFMGAHPNCESMYLLISDGQAYRPASYYLKTSMVQVAGELLDLEGRMTKLSGKLDTGVFGSLLEKLGAKKQYLRLRSMMGAGALLWRNINLSRAIQGSGLGKIGHAIAFLFGLISGTPVGDLLKRHANGQSVFQIIILPFEDKSTLETERLERCPTAFAYYDPDKDEVKTCPVCAWGIHKTGVMKRVGEYYKTNAGPAGAEISAAKAVAAVK